MPTRKFLLPALFLIGCTHHHPTLSTTLLTPDGHPAAGALAVLVPTGHAVQVTDGQSFDDDPAFSRATADSQGRISLTPTTRPSLLAVIHPTGTLHLSDSNLDHLPHTLRLTPWSHIQGTRFIGPNPAPDRPIGAWADRGETTPYDPHVPTVRYVSTTRSDPAGHYLLSHFPPGPVFLAPDDPTSWGQPISRPLTTLTLQPNQTATQNLGGQGRPVEGRITIPFALPPNSPAPTYYLCLLSPNLPEIPSPLPPDLKTQPPTAQSVWWTRFNSTAAGHSFHGAEAARLATLQSHTYPFSVRPDGSFHVDDVPPGNYELYLELRIPPAPGKNPVKQIGECKTTFTLPPANAGSPPFILPPTPVTPTTLLNVGDPAPDFTVPTLDDHTLQLSSLHGKYVLLQFWATWCGPCVAEMDNVKSAQAAFANDPHITFVSLSFDPSPDLPTRFAATHHFPWPQTFLGDMTTSPVATQYGITSIPSIFLISPEGKILLKNLRGESLQSQLTQILHP